MPLHYGPSYHRSIQNAGESDFDQRWKRQRNTVLAHKPSGRLLDIGCGTGPFLRTLPRENWQLYGVEISPPEAEKARVLTGAEIFVGDPLDAAFAPGNFDVVTCFHLLEHIYTPMALLHQINKWLKPDGILYVIVPNIESWEARIFHSYWYGLELPRHVFHFSPESLKRMMDALNMRPTILCTPSSDSYAEHSLRYLFEDFLKALGLRCAPLSAGSATPFPIKVIRKLFRLSVETSFRHLAGVAGRGASIEAVFCKR
jgi:SAM-dependent methyltransferase